MMVDMTAGLSLLIITFISDVTVSNNGACLTLKEMAHFAYNEQKELAGVVYQDAWDAE